MKDWNEEPTQCKLIFLRKRNWWESWYASTHAFYPQSGFCGYLPQLAWNNVCCRLEETALDKDVSSPAHYSTTDSQSVNPALKQTLKYQTQQASFFSWILQQSWQYLASDRVSMSCLSSYQVEVVTLHHDLIPWCNQGGRKRRKYTLLCSSQKCIMTKTLQLTNPSLALQGSVL